MNVTERITWKIPTDSFAPYVDQALHDQKLHERAKKAYASGRDVYVKLGKEPDLVSAVGRLASDEKLQRQARAALVELQRAAHLIGRRPSRRRQRARALVIAAAVAIAVLTASRRAAEA